MPTVNGREYQHATISFDVTGSGSTFPVTKFKKISYKDGADKKPVMDSKGQIIGYTIDNQKTEGSISLLLSHWDALKDWLMSQPQNQGLGIGQIETEFIVTYGNSPSNYRTDNVRVMFNEDPRDSQDNQEVLVADIPLFVMSVVDDQGNSFINY